jgi:hypothetical protein
MQALVLMLAAAAATAPSPPKAAQGSLAVSAVIEVGCTVKAVGRSAEIRCGGRASPPEIKPPPRWPHEARPAERVTITF